MCGITGILGCAERPIRSDIIAKMTDSLAHRGPDDCDYYHDERISLGHRRLSINDLEGGRQPITNETDDIILICNGEIYNSPQLREALIKKGHVFKTGSDVEVIIHLYEEYAEKCVQYLQGMFAFALWDSTHEKLLLARDHLGQKPLFYKVEPNGILFGSEVKSVLASQPEKAQLNTEALWHYMSMRYLPDDFSLINGIDKLPAATFLVYENDTIRKEKYWNLSFNDKPKKSLAQATDELDDLLTETIDSHMLSDVRVGGFLSGGIDSSLIMAKMSGLSETPVPSFSIGVAEAGFNELPYAKMVSDQYNLEAHTQVVQADLINLIPEMIFHLDEPADPYGVGVYLASGLAQQHVKVVLTGDGADECFGGYDRFFGQRLADYYSWMPEVIRKQVMTRLIGLVPESFGYKSFGQKAKWLNDMSFYEKGERYANSMSTLRFTTDTKEQLFSEQAQQQIRCKDSNEKILEHFNADNAEHIVDNMLNTDIMTRLPDHLLTVSDRMSMAHSLETRAPFVDYKLVEYAASLPANFKVNGSRLKYILRQVSTRHLPTQLTNRKKQGFGFPLGLWLRTDLASFMIALFNESRFVAEGIFNKGFIDKLVTEHISGRSDHNYRLWMLINLEFWFRMYIDEMPLNEVHEEIKRFRAA